MTADVVSQWTSSWCDAIARRGLARLTHGRLTVADGQKRETFGGAGRADLAATITVASGAAFRRLVLGGSLGGAEAYLRGEWTTDDLPAVLRILAANLDAADRFDSPLARLVNLPSTLTHRLRRNSRKGSRRNIREHYDLGNDLFALFLDETMTYSCGVFERQDASLREASVAKLDLVCRKLALDADHRVLEVGGGWGSFAIHAASRYGCHVTTTTVSRAQFDVATARVAAAGLADRVSVRLDDYRDLRGTYDRLVSIEMIEAVGARYLPDYFAACAARLAPGGQMLLQGIVLPEYRYRSYLRSADFVQRYVFPGGALTSLGAIAQAIGAGTDLSVLHVEDLSPHYARTLRLWREAFLERREDALRLGYDERFIKLWEFYLAYCEAGFAEHCTSVVQMLLTRPLRHAAAPWNHVAAHVVRRPAAI
ncbi:MAG: cyclopropane-fatty-acyl-phospholipid synthase family protein [Vicinamibacteraceae bacterium]